MGNNSAFSAFEETVVACYKHDALTKPLLKDLCAAFRGQDADSGGYSGTLAKGKDVYEIVVEVGGGKVPTKPKLPKDYLKWTPEQDKANEDYHEALHDQFNKIADLD